ncbi:hypothetical protein [Streptomyces olivoreticuli]|uniref:hypothetical protein n=1 Tax=Streptomyces olivoreticuli TaxID=68246 RepID=UPI000E259C34|nr:hypothetical protein [Streptomyces olivoreticuli]
MKRIMTTVVTAAALLTVAGCSSQEDTRGNAASPADRSKAVMAVAVTYQQAMMDHDWTHVCQMQTSQQRFGRTVQECVAAYSPHHSAAPSESPDAIASPAPESTVTATSNAADSLGPVTAEPPIDVPGNSEHPAGTGVMVMFTAEGTESSRTYRYALRLVRSGGTWQVDQRETVFDSDIAHGDPVRTALGKTQ